jgi:hypothetical protein
MTLQLGLKPFQPDSVKLKFGTYFNIKNLPPVPLSFGYGSRMGQQRIHEWGMLANDTVGDCVLAGAAHETMLFRADVGPEYPSFSNEAVLSDYSAITGYDPNNPDTDKGTDMQAAAAYRQKTGVIDADGVRHKIDVYAELNMGDLALATFLFGAVGVGVNITQSAMDEFQQGEVWTQTGGKVLGGHYIPCVGRNTRGNWLFVTWGRLHAATPRWLNVNMLGAIAYFSRERLSSEGLSPQGYDAATLNDDFQALTG